jgi:hypothetical protein
MRRGQVRYTYVPLVMPYGRVPMIGGNVYLETGKTVAKKAIPMLAKLWKKMSPEMKAAVISGGIELGAKGAKRAGDAVRSGLNKLGSSAEEKLGKLLCRKSSKKVGKKARKMF